MTRWLAPGPGSSITLDVVCPLCPILDAAVGIPSGHPRQPGGSGRRVGGVIGVIGVAEEWLGMDVGEVAWQTGLKMEAR